MSPSAAKYFGRSSSQRSNSRATSAPRRATGRTPWAASAPPRRETGVCVEAMPRWVPIPKLRETDALCRLRMRVRCWPRPPGAAAGEQRLESGPGEVDVPCCGGAGRVPDIQLDVVMGVQLYGPQITGVRLASTNAVTGPLAGRPAQVRAPGPRHRRTGPRCRAPGSVTRHESRRR